jgi:hypothetical protein
VVVKGNAQALNVERKTSCRPLRSACCGGAYCCLPCTQALEEAVLNREHALQDPSLPFLEFEDILATIGEKLPIHVSDSLYAILSAPSALPDVSQVGGPCQLCTQT